jgi:hypothetical protein
MKVAKGNRRVSGARAPFARVLSLALLSTACSETYIPANSPRIAVVSDGYYRDGRKYSRGFFGEGVEDVVRGNPRAEAEAKHGVNLMVGGFSLVVGGAVLGGSGVALAATSESRTSQAVGAGLLVGGIAAYVTGLVLTLSGVPHLFDAVNIYNDAVAEPWQMPPTPAPPPWSPAPAPMAPPPAPVPMMPPPTTGPAAP